MSRFGFTGSGPGPIEVDRPAAGSNGNAAPTEGERTPRQRSGSPLGYGGALGSAIGGGGIFGGIGGIVGGAGFDGATTGISWALPFDGPAPAGLMDPLAQLFAPSWNTFRFMRGLPTIAMVRGMVMAPLISTNWTVEKLRESVPVEWTNYAERVFLPMRRKIFSAALRGLDYGFFPFEKVWQFRAGYWDLIKLKPLTVDYNRILADRSGNYAGLRPAGGGSDGRDDLGPLKSWIYSHDAEAAGDLYGRARMLNAHFTFLRWLNTAMKSDQLKTKLAGIIPIFYHPPGAFEDPPGSGTWVSYQDACKAAAKQIQQGDYCTVEHMGFRAEDIVKNPDLLKMGQVSIDFYQAGDYSAAQGGMVAELQYLDRLLMRSWLQPERSALESSSGTRADATAHKDVGAEDLEVVSGDIDDQFAAGVVDDALAVNFGEQARGAIRLTTPPQNDRKTNTHKEMILALIKAGLAPDFGRAMDIGDMLAGMDIPTLTKFIVTAAAKPPGPGGAPGGDGGGDAPPADDGGDDGGDGGPNGAD